MQKESNYETTCDEQVNITHKDIEESTQKDNCKGDEMHSSSTEIVSAPAEECSTKYEAEVLN